MFSFVFCLILLQTIVIDAKTMELHSSTRVIAQSCLDYLKKGYKSDGFYKIRDFNANRIITVYCDLTSEPGSAWTLVMSFAFKNRQVEQFKKKGLQQDAPVNENSPNWEIYRMSHYQMNYLKSQSTHWRATCSYPKNKVDYRDYVRAKFSDFDVMTFAGYGICKKVELVNIRGHQCAKCTSKWYQVLNTYMAHIDSPSSGCKFDARTGSFGSEDNFGYYSHVNKKFRCTASRLSTTNWWFGVYMTI
ncbi:uncharacterized protein LOC124437112 [Xenia sp. Carnegie-2017]|uniref:uncharacterized protein LOC124437112 n=1 Tax=Xenia sp. Carnegie-2017 TaxID=2897299 RepID=UPI001F0465F3|nr:uncharacterized protein LOC124437112 [Xenia sp. Carnegie-2017]